MAVTAFWYANALKNLLDRGQNIDIDTNTIKVLLTTSAYTPNQDTHSDKGDITNEITGTGYTAGGATLASKTVATTNNVLNVDAADPSWAGATFTARRAAYYDDSGATDADKALLSWNDFGADESVTAGTFTIQHHADGIVKITAADAAGFPA